LVGRCACALVIALLGWAAPAAAQSEACALEILLPLPVGASGTGKHEDNRIYRALQGTTYEIPTGVICGTYPYTYSLNNAPDGMTVTNAGEGETCGIASTVLSLTHVQCGLITWTNPQADATPEVCVTDSAETPAMACAEWPIDVMTTIGADGFCVIDAASGDNTTGDGSLANPWQTLVKAQASCGARSILYLRYAGGTPYTLTGLTLIDSGLAGACATSTMVEAAGMSRWQEGSAPVIWIGYPGESRPKLTYGYTGSGEVPCLRFEGTNTWIEGIEHYEINQKAVDYGTGTFGRVFWDNVCHTAGPGATGANSSCIISEQAYPTQSYGDLYIENRFHTITIGVGFAPLKLYSTQKALVEGNICEDIVSITTPEGEACYAIKSDNTDVTVRANIYRNGVANHIAFGGNMHNVSDCTSGVYEFNLAIISNGLAARVNQDSQACATRYHRNTFIGRVRLESVNGADGPFTFTLNVIEPQGFTGGGSCPERITCQSVTEYASIVVNANNLQGAVGDNTDANGELEGSALTNYGPASATPTGHMVGEGGGDPEPEPEAGSGRPRLRIKGRVRLELPLFDRALAP
jgi:hypothetical protein